jgi:carbamoyl-phosphate synthase large subunit
VKSQLAAGVLMPVEGKVFISVRDEDKDATIDIGRSFIDAGFELVATRGTADALAKAGLEVVAVNKVAEGRPHIVDMIKNGEIAMIINTVGDTRSSIQDSYSIRRTALQGRVTYYTTLAGARAAISGIRKISELTVCSVQSAHQQLH